MNAIVDIIVPVFGTVAVGWLIGRTRLLSPEGLRGLTNVTFYALFPALLFRSMSQVRVQALSLDILVVFFGTALLLYFPLMLLGRVLGMRLGDRTVFALSSTFSNGVGIGIPFTVATLNAALPAGANVYLVAQLYRTGVGLATNAVVISTGASIFTLSAALLLLGVQAR